MINISIGPIGDDDDDDDYYYFVIAHADRLSQSDLVHPLPRGRRRWRRGFTALG